MMREEKMTKAGYLAGPIPSIVRLTGQATQKSLRIFIPLQSRSDALGKNGGVINTQRVSKNR